jgi:hypothetical protein
MKVKNRQPGAFLQSFNSSNSVFAQHQNSEVCQGLKVSNLFQSVVVQVKKYLENISNKTCLKHFQDGETSLLVSKQDSS